MYFIEPFVVLCFHFYSLIQILIFGLHLGKDKNHRLFPGRRRRFSHVLADHASDGGSGQRTHLGARVAPGVETNRLPISVENGLFKEAESPTFFVN